MTDLDDIYCSYIHRLIKQCMHACKVIFQSQRWTCI